MARTPLAGGGAARNLLFALIAACTLAIVAWGSENRLAILPAIISALALLIGKEN